MILSSRLIPVSSGIVTVLGAAFGGGLDVSVELDVAFNGLITLIKF